MHMDELASRGLVLLGCGKMGSAMLEGWLSGAVPAGSVWVRDPRPSDWLQGQGINLNTDLPEDPAMVMVAVKPQIMAAALPELRAFGNGRTVFLSVAAGTPIRFFEESLGEKTPVIRAMPNTPAAIRRGITAIVGNDRVAPGASGHTAINGYLVREDLSNLDGFSAVALWSECDDLAAARAALAHRAGPLIPLIATSEMAEFCVLEKHVCTDTTAAGGNASLLAMI